MQPKRERMKRRALAVIFLGASHGTMAVSLALGIPSLLAFLDPEIARELASIGFYPVKSARSGDLGLLGLGAAAALFAAALFCARMTRRYGKASEFPIKATAGGRFENARGKLIVGMLLFGLACGLAVVASLGAESPSRVFLKLGVIATFGLLVAMAGYYQLEEFEPAAAEPRKRTLIRRLVQTRLGSRIMGIGRREATALEYAADPVTVNADGHPGHRERTL